MTFALRLFGGLELSDTVISGARNRRLVTLLAARRNQAVAKWDVIDALWNGEPPPTAEGTLSAMVSRLRTTIQPGTSLALPEASSGNYTLTVEPTDCDLDVFERRARHFLADPSNRLESANSALELWRGEPFGEFSAEHFALVETIRLARLRDAVEEALTDALLNKRRYSEALIVIDQLAARTDLSQSSCVSRLRALAGLGRHREALLSFYRFKEELADTGNSLTVELAHWEQRLLNAESDVSGVGGAGYVAVPPEGRYAVGSFFGRSDEIELVRQLILDCRLVTLTGEGGIGKSRLTIEVCAGRQALWCDLEAAVTLDDVVGRLMAAVGATASAGSNRASHRSALAAIVEALSENNVPLVLDGCPVELDGFVELVGGLLARTPVHILASSRRAIGVSGERLHRLGPLTANDPASSAVALLIDRARAAGATVDREDPLIGEIAVRLDGHPLSVEIVAPRLASLAPIDVLFNLNSGTGSSGQSAVGQLLDDTVRSTYDRLSPDAQRLFRCISVFQSGGIGVDVVRRLMRLLDGGSDPTYGLLELAENSLIRPEAGVSGELRYRMLAPIADVGCRMAAASDESMGFRRARTQALIQMLDAAEHAGYGEHEARWADVIGEELAAMRMARADCLAHGWLDLHARLVAGLEAESVLRDNIEIQQWAVDLAEHEDLRTTDHASVVYAMAANALMLRGDMAGAIRCALDSQVLVERGARPSWVAPNTLFLITVLQCQGRIDDRARVHLDSMRAASAMTGDPMGEVAAEYGLAYVTSSVGRPLEGVASAIHCERLARAHRSPTLSSMARLSVARSRMGLNPHRAIDQLCDAELLAKHGRCVLVERHAVRSRLEATVHADAAPAVSWLAKQRHNAPIAQLLQEVTGLLVPLAQAGDLELVARLCGGLSRTLWLGTAAVRSAGEFVESRMGAEAYRSAFRRGRRLDEQAIVDAVLERWKPPIAEPQ